MTNLGKKCIVMGCSNRQHEGFFVGDLCSPCHEFITKGEGTSSQAYRNAFLGKEHILVAEVDSYEVGLYLGNREGYNGRVFDEEELVLAIENYQNTNAIRLPVRITPTRFVDKSYNEKGWEVVAICYPRRPQHSHSICEFMTGLARYLIIAFKQNRISVVGPSKTQMFYHKSDQLSEEVVITTSTIKDGYL